MQDNAPGMEDDEISLLDLAQTVVDNLRLLVLGPLAVGLAALGISFAVPPTYTAKTLFLPPQQQQSAAASMLASLGSLGGLAGAVSGIKNPSDQYIAFMKSNAVQDALIEQFKLKDRYNAHTKTDTRLALTGNVRIASSKDGLMSVEVDDKDPQFAAALANAHVQELRVLMGKLAVTEAQQRRLFFEKQLAQAKDNLTAAEVALKGSGISDSVLKSNPASAVAAVASLKVQVTAQEVKVGAMRGYLAESAPDFKQAMAELANLRVQLAKQDRDEAPAGSGTGAAGQSGKDGKADYITNYRNFKYYETLYELFAKQYELARVDESREGAVIQVLDAAQPPERKSKPKKALIAIIATLASGFALLLFVFVRQALRNGSQDEETAKKLAAIRTGWKRAIGKA
jgi:uncharacterized protein involved in exopolysaccharide biosynthesis